MTINIRITIFEAKCSHCDEQPGWRGQRSVVSCHGVRSWGICPGGKVSDKTTHVVWASSLLSLTEYNCL